MHLLCPFYGSSSLPISTARCLVICFSGGRCVTLYRAFLANMIGGNGCDLVTGSVMTGSDFYILRKRKRGLTFTSQQSFAVVRQEDAGELRS